MKRILFALIGSIALIACGGGGGDPDAGDDDGADARVDGPSLPPGCNYAELNDTSNDMTPEPTGTVLGASAFTYCGTIGARPPVMNVIDNDAYSLSVSADTSAIIRLTITGTPPAMTLLGADIVNMAGETVSSGLFIGNHAVLAANLAMAAGPFKVEAFAVGMAAPTAAISYKLSVATDTPLTRCPAQGGAATFTEANDLVTNQGNDVLEVRFGPPFAMTTTASAIDNPEPSGVIVGAPMSIKLAGTSAAGTNPPDDYLDRDTFVFTTGPMTNQVDIHLNWPGADADLDFFFLPVPAGQPASFASGLGISNSAPEFATHAVLPDTQYWVWASAFNVNATGGAQVVPKAYDVTVCGTNFVPAP